MRIVMLGIDLGKNLCSLAGLDETGAVVLRRRMKRASVLPFTAHPIAEHLHPYAQTEVVPATAQPPSQVSSDRRLAQRSFGERRSLSTEGPASIRPAIRSQVSAMASRSARPFSAETVRALSRHLAASRRYSSGLFLVMGSCRRAGPYNTCLASPRRADSAGSKLM
jgi:hypothetical protein